MPYFDPIQDLEKMFMKYWIATGHYCVLVRIILLNGLINHITIMMRRNFHYMVRAL